MQPGAKLQRISRGLYFAVTPARSVLDFESFAGRGQMLDGRVLGASQVEYKPFGKPPLKREIPGMQGFPALNSPHDLIQNCSMVDSCCRAILQQNCAPLARHRSPAAPARHQSHTPARRVIRIIRSYGHTAAWHCATLPRLPGIGARAKVGILLTEVGIPTSLYTEVGFPTSL